MDFPFSTDNAQTARLVVEADFDPQFPSRVLQRFSERNTLPLRLQMFTMGDSDSLRIEIEFASSIEAARLLARRILNLPSARSVDLGFRRLGAMSSPQRQAA